MKRYEDYQVPELEQNPPQAKDINNNENIIVPMEQVREWAFALANGQTRNAKFPVGFIPDDENCPKMNPDEGQVEITLITPTDGKCWKCADAGCEVCQVPKHNPQEVKPAPVEVSPIGEKAVISENPSPNPPLNKKWLSNEFTGLLITPKIGLEKVKKYKSKFIKFWNNADEATKKYFQERLAKRPTEIQNAVKAWMNIKANPGENMITDVVVNGTGVETQLQNVSEVLIVNPPEEAKVEITPVAPVVVPTVVEAPVVAPVVETPIVPVVENPPLPPQPVQMTCEHELKYLGKGNPKKGGKTLDVYKCQKCKKNYVWSV